MLFKKLTVFLIIYLSSMIWLTQIYGLDVMVGGESIGIVLNYDAICVTGFYDIEVNQQVIDPAHYFKINDLIIEVENQKISSIEELTNSIKTLSTNKVNFIVEREGKQVPIQMDIYKKGNEFSTGLYVKDSTKGIGTVTYYRIDTNEFASLGHCLNDNEHIIEHGNIFGAPISSIKKSSNSEIGQKIGNIENSSLGKIEKNNDYGVFGIIDTLPKNNIYQTASQDEIKNGDAYFLTVLKNNEIKKCKIRIDQIIKQDKPDEKGIHFTLIDQEVIDSTNGIIQGMSGSPIIQNNKLIGCVTHASSQNNLQGYGMFIQWMIDNS